MPTTTGRSRRARDRAMEVIAGEELPPLVPDGKYTFHTRRVEIRPCFRRLELYLHGEIVDPGLYDGARLYWCAPWPGNGSRPGLSSKFYQAWMRTTGRRPDRGERMAAAMLVAKRFRVAVRTVVKNRKGQDHPVPSRYSIVDELLERLA